jgi:putative sterol carrier protein
MATFKDADQFYECVGGLMDIAKRDSSIGKKIAKSNVVIQFRYTDPDAMTTIDAKNEPSQPDSYVDVFHGDCDLNPDIVMSMKADVSHAFWHGKVNLMSAMAKKEIIAKGSIPKILKLLPAVQPLYDEYPKLLHELGYDDLIIK